MPHARENKNLSVIEYNIAGNAIRAYYDNDDELIFVLDETINADKPNVLLVIDSFDGRKWDDILANDYNVDLETVRPKRDNKYQKLDIEYGGLDVYAELINANKSGNDLNNAITNLTRFRTMSVRRAATERLAAANDVIEKSQETIERTNDAISDLRSKIKEMRARLTEYRRKIGREPTKTSAAKILKAEAQLDATNEKLTRAKKRLTNAQHRLTNAENDAEIARAILARNTPNITQKQNVSALQSHAQPVIVDSMVPTSDADYDIEDTEEVFPEPKAEEMAEEVKPLFDKDPENLNDEIAFKPIDFTNVEDVHDEQPIAPAPLSFTPPVQNASEIDNTHDTSNTPMLDGLTPVPQTESHETPIVPTESHPEPETQQPETPVDDGITTPDPFIPEEPVAPVAPATNVRPVSPISGNITPVEQKPQKSTFMYYLMLILLILLSIGTLWLYQKSTSENIPDLSKSVSETTVAPQNVKATTPDKESNTTDSGPFISMPKIISDKNAKAPETTTTPEPIATPATEPEPVSIEPETVSVEPEIIPAEPVTLSEEAVAVVNVEPEEDVPVESPFINPEPAVTTIATYEPEPVKIPSEEEVIATKPGYNVSQNDNMFVASQDYDTETVFTNTEEEPEPACENGATPDASGCCPGENYTYTESGFMCCNTIECFPPLN